MFHAIVKKRPFVENYYYDTCNHKHMTTKKFQSLIVTFEFLISNVSALQTQQTTLSLIS